ncbi:S-adenosyl-L-methionine-dependent methyltransferase [Fragilariopsis cylindrus CCMP1102]|uniref:Cytosine-specific methyltransferase n=1 Tax=Fragilariopsis cylindrus CCMP1102 TaxID=635003 RepID=A0A1E7FCN5_9STRA|nr:S-adenosyl-L-methionine-dependent methyltransferase [Fragilariopsis cylindrus CCMP1102]|eukprot:OEU15938.1 S-adenosyl-L-methionine-dependent methyltransferase [Fragilariopsis cylindrus CCMP1102]
MQCLCSGGKNKVNMRDHDPWFIFYGYEMDDWVGFWCTLLVLEPKENKIKFTLQLQDQKSGRRVAQGSHTLCGGCCNSTQPKESSPLEPFRIRDFVLHFAQKYDYLHASLQQQNQLFSPAAETKKRNLDRRIRKIRNDPGRKVVEYKVRWKSSSLSANEESTCWLIAENLDQNSLASAFRQFPVDLDPDDRRHSTIMTTTTTAINGKIQQQQQQEQQQHGKYETSDSLFRRMATEEEQDIDASGLSNPSMKIEISHLGESEYDQPGTVELMINRRVYRVGQSFVSSENNKGRVIYTITTLIPRPRKAVCQRFVLFDDTFVCPKGFEGTHVQLTEDVTVDLSSLKLPYKRSIRKLPLRYEQDNDQQRSFCYYNEEGKIQNHFPQCKPTALDLFAGVGGMSMGLKNAGFDVKFAVENNHLTAATLQANNCSSSNVGHVFVEDVKVFLKRCHQGHPCYPSAGDVDHIHASTPCKGFSRANRNGGKDDLRNNQQTLLFIKAIKHFKPMTATFENVPGLILKDYKRYLQSMVTSLLRMSYQVRVAVLTASLYGDPQNRRRLILWAARKDCVLPSLPIETHGTRWSLSIDTCKDALQALEEHNTCRTSSGVTLID